MTAKKEIKKEIKKAPVKSKVEMISYSMRMVIPTGDYANVQPEIIVKAGTPEEALDYIAPHMNKLWKEYFMISKKKLEVVETPKAPPVRATPVATPQEEASPVSDVALVKATQAIQSCLSTDALDLIIKQVAISVKLTEENKQSLLPIIEEKSSQLNAPKQ